MPTAAVIQGSAISSNLRDGYLRRNQVQLIHGGREYFDMLEQLIMEAESMIHLQVYIFSDDQTGTRIADALAGAARRGVAVYLLIDGYVARGLSSSFTEKLRGAGIHLRRFEPLFRSRKFYIGRRLHHKVAVFDGIRALTGGINVADRYAGAGGTPAWLDMAVFLTGEAANELYRVCADLWNEETGELLPPPVVCRFPAPGQPQWSGSGMDCSVRIRRNDWVRGRQQIWKSYFELFAQASESIVVMSSYFLPGWIFLRRIKKAIRRGVNVKVVLAGISDVPLAKHAERYLYRWMLKNGVEIYEYKDAVLHAKVAVRDHRWMTIGSYNVNNISAYASIELNVDIRNRPFVAAVQEELLRIAQERSTRITPENFRVTQHPFRRFWQWACYQIIRLVLYLATFYFRQEVLPSRP